MGPRWIYSGILCLLLVCVYFGGQISYFIHPKTESNSFNYNCTEVMSKLNSDKSNQDDTRLIKAIKRCFIETPSILPYNLKNPGRPDYSQRGQKSSYLDSLLNEMKNGFFVECGANDGESISNTLSLELYRSWTGLLIEPLSREFEIMRGKNRKAFIINACLSKHVYPTQVQVEVQGLISRITEKGSRLRTETIQCFPLYSILMAINRTRIDLFSLDIEGDELTILKTIPWEKVDIKVLFVEHKHIKEGKQALIDYMVANDYTNLPEIKGKGWYDVVFIKNGFNYNTEFASTAKIKNKK